MTDTEDRPITYVVDVARALASLDHDEMMALAAMFERWALTETDIDSELRTKLIQWSSDYAAIAAFAGVGWKAGDPSGSPSLLAFVARRELRSRR